MIGLSRQTHRDEAIGDLAKDVRMDCGTNDLEDNFDAWEEHLYHRGASLAALNTLVNAWDEYSGIY